MAAIQSTGNPMGRSLSGEEQIWLAKVAAAPALTPRSPEGGRPSGLVPVSLGDMVGPYAIERELGRGGMGVVFEAVHGSIGQHVAIKVLHCGTASHDELVKRFVNEARAASLVRHPNVVQVFDLGHLKDGTPYILMEFVEGEPLSQRLRRGTLSFGHAARIARQIACALSSVHARGIVHRDLKPENVILSLDEATEGGERAKILDFGIAHFSDMSDRITSDGRVLGTPAYMAPEQCLGSAPSDGACDVYALGVMLFESVVGEPPFRGRGALILQAHVTTPPPLWRLPDDVPDRLRALIARSLAKDPAARPNAVQLVEELRAIEEMLSGERSPRRARMSMAQTLASRPVIAGAALRRFGRKRVRSAAVVSFVGLASLVAWGFAAAASRYEPPEVALSGMRWLRGGSFIQGSTEEEIARQCKWLGENCRRPKLDAQQPPREVQVSPFYIDEHEVTNTDYARMLNATPPAYRVERDEERDAERYVHLEATGGLLVDLWYRHSGIAWDGKVFSVRPGYERLPVVQVTWDGASLYCKSQGKRLPTEAEWEYAARGADHRRFPWGDQDPSCDTVVYGRDPKQVCDGFPRAPSPVGTAPRDATPDGVMDLGGNVMEWVDDAAILPYYPDCGDCVDPRETWNGRPEEDFRVLRGSGWSNSGLLHATARTRWSRSAVADDVGFRCAANDSRG